MLKTPVPQAMLQLPPNATMLPWNTGVSCNGQRSRKTEAETEYAVAVDGESVGVMTTNLGGKLSLSVEVQEENPVAISVYKK